MYPRLFPLLLLLSRMRPTISEESHGPADISKIISLLLHCRTLKNHKARVMAARSLAAIVSLTTISNILSEIISQELPQSFRQLSSVNFNRVHESLLQLYHILSGVDSILSRADTSMKLSKRCMEIYYNVGSLLNSILWLRERVQNYPTHIHP